MSFNPYNWPLKIRESIGTPTPKVGVHPLTTFYSSESMKCDSQVSFLAGTLTSPCFGREPKAKVATTSLQLSCRKCCKMLVSPLSPCLTPC
jgi:hypothetical protein